MKKQELDDLEHLFKDGLQNLNTEPDDSVWLGIQDAMKKRHRFWLFWGLGGVVAIGLVTSILFYGNKPATLSQSKVNPSTLEKHESILPENQNKVAAKQGKGTDELPFPTEIKPSNANQETSNAVDPASHSNSNTSPSNPNLTDNTPTSPTSPKPGVNANSNPVTFSSVPGTGQENPINTEGPNKELTQISKTRSFTQRIALLVIPFTYTQPSSEYTFALLPPYKSPTPNTTPPKSNDSVLSGWSIAFNPSMIVPSIQSIGQKGMVNYDKTNRSKNGLSLALALSYQWKQNWFFRGGLEWSQYRVSGNQRYYGLTDTVEWIDRERKTGVQLIHTDKSYQFESTYQWVSIPLEIGRRQNFGGGLSWDWTLGAGFNYLYRYGKLAENIPELAQIDASINRFQLSLSAGFGVHYAWKGPWSSFVNVRYAYQPGSLYQSNLLQEKHPLLRFGIGLQYHLNLKGN